MCLSLYTRLTVTDANGYTAQGSVAVNVTTTLSLWRQAKFTAAELADPEISGDEPIRTETLCRTFSNT